MPATQILWKQIRFIQTQQQQQHHAIEKSVNSQFQCVCQWSKCVHQRLLRTMDCERFSRRPKRHHFCHEAQSAFHFAQWPCQHNLFEILDRLAKIATPTNRTVLIWRNRREWVCFHNCWVLKCVSGIFQLTPVPMELIFYEKSRKQNNNALGRIVCATMRIEWSSTNWFCEFVVMRRTVRVSVCRTASIAVILIYWHYYVGTTFTGAVHTDVRDGETGSHFSNKQNRFSITAVDRFVVQRHLIQFTVNYFGKKIAKWKSMRWVPMARRSLCHL